MPKITIEENLDSEIQKFRVSSKDKKKFLAKCIQSNVKMVDAFRWFMKKVNAGEIKLETDNE